MDGFCLIVSGGEFCPLPQALSGARYTIACDRGYLHARRLGLRPDLILGDFDSAPPPDAQIRTERFPARKDDTDTMLAVRRALDLGFRDIAVCCALGGRADHALANLQAGAFIASRGGRARLFGRDTEITVFSRGTEVFPRRPETALSVFSLSGECTGVTMEGTQYDCRDITLVSSFPLGVSNGWAAGAARITVKTGILAVVLSGTGGRKGDA